MTTKINMYHQLLCTFEYHLNLQLYETELLIYGYYNNYLDIDNYTNNKDITYNIYQILNDILKLINNLQNNKNNFDILILIYQNSIKYYEYQLFQLYTYQYNKYILYNNNNNNEEKMNPISININKKLFEEKCLVCYKIESKCTHFISGNCTRNKCSFCHCV